MKITPDSVRSATRLSVAVVSGRALSALVVGPTWAKIPLAVMGAVATDVVVQALEPASDAVADRYYETMSEVLLHG